MKWKISARICSAVLLFVVSLICQAGARVITVDDDAAADFDNIQAAIDSARDGDTVIIHPGLYTGSNNRNIDFEGKRITVRSTDPDDANIVASTIIDCNGLTRAFEFISGERPSSVLDGLTIINGFSPEDGGAIYCVGSEPTIKNCTFADNVADCGGAIRCESESRPIIENCLFTNNSASHGGAVYCYESRAVITSCVFSHNAATYSNGSGGALRIYDSGVTISDSTFSDNSAQRSGGAIRCSGEMSVRNCLFTRCSATSGGAIFIVGTFESGVTLTNCRLIGNSALPGEFFSEQGGALVVVGNARLVNCLFAGNSGSLGGAIMTGAANMSIAKCTFASNYADEGKTLYVNPSMIVGDLLPGPSSLTISVENSILWDGEGSVVTIGDPPYIQLTIEFSFCDMAGAAAGGGNIDADPCFAAPGHWADANDVDIAVEPNDANAVWVHGDYHLKSQAGRWNPTEGRWTTDEVTSPCIDAGDPASPVGHEAFPNGGIVNMGFYGGTADASKSYFGQAPCETVVAGDVNGDCVIDARDFAIMAGHWLVDNTIPSPSRAMNPNPPDGATGVETTLALSWTTGSGALSHDVYFGTTSPGIFQGNQSEATFEPWALDYNRTYYWRIDEVNDVGTTAGVVWSFQTGSRPRTASHPVPLDGATDVRLNPILSWEPGLGALSHDVYFGEESPGAFQGNQEGTTFQPGNLTPYRSTYYWRVDEVNDVGTTTGPVWSFTTEIGKVRRCFPADTLVWADDRPVPIIEVRPGQKVGMVASTAEANGKFTPIVETRPDGQPCVFSNAAEVEYLQEHGIGRYDCYDMMFETGNSLVVVHSHNFLTVSGQWVAVENLSSGSKLQSLNGPIGISSIVKRAMPFVGNAYNLKIKGANVFFVGKDGVAAVDCSKLPGE